MEVSESQVGKVAYADTSDSSEAGQACRRVLEQRLGAERLTLWFGPASQWEFQNDKLIVRIENAFLVDCVRSFCWDELKRAVSEAGYDGAAIQLICDESVKVNVNERPSVKSPLSITPPMIARRTEADRREPAKTLSIAQSSVVSVVASPKSIASSNSLTKPPEADWWQEFVCGESSRLVWTAAEMLVERPGTISPLFIHGPCGSGKSHLAKAIAHRLRQRCGLRRTILMTAEQFTIDYTESARGAGFASFRKKYRDVDSLVIDDLQFCIGKSGTITELRNTLDHLIRDHRQVVLVADKPLSELSALGSDLVARIAGGMTCGLEPLDVETRRRILKRLIAKYELQVSESAIEQLAESTGGDGRALYGIAFRLLAEQRRLNRPLTCDEAIGVSLDLVRASQPVVRLTDIERAVCESFRLDPKSLQAKGKTKFVSGPRMLAMFLARKHTRAAYAEIGEYFGKRQHSTVISAQKKVAQWLESNEAVSVGGGSIGIRDVVRRIEATLQVG